MGAAHAARRVQSFLYGTGMESSVPEIILSQESLNPNRSLEIFASKM